ncbi:baseplate J/gp47 family protein [Lactobacillus hamsteri]|uniref:Phage Mu gp47 related protein n=1 Tax=Lactobacillus hamsteri DSM 5661 = JCM 6256 TaxID=1423754 RepID=A0A0R1Y4U8_9LACO|nr:baseplate J/gp47 family protein [Lactobacillus hamsteri]KRM36993.1 Phage Mu gp47 related protein [Lactobacillus hamsteri DSM 5661 = JCM 6256]
MNPEELARTFEERNFNYWKDEMLDEVPDDIDKREGSIVYDAIAPAAMLLAQQSLNMAMIIKQTYIRTATGEFLDYRAVEHGTSRYPATYAEVKAVIEGFDHQPIDNVALGDRFASIGDIPNFYKVVKLNDDSTVTMQAEVSGTGANSYIGQILPVTPNDRVNWAEIIEVTVPARNAETDDHLRARLLGSQNWIAYGGNVADYLDMCSEIDTIGAAQIYPTWAGPGTVKVVILNNDLKPASKDLCHQVKEALDPEEKTTEGYGLAPIDHRVTVVAPEALIVNVRTRVKLEPQASIVGVMENIKKTLESYFSRLRDDWAQIDPVLGRGYAQAIYRSQILSRIMNVSGVANATLPYLNDEDEDINLIFNNNLSQLPMLGEVTLDG